MWAARFGICRNVFIFTKLPIVRQPICRTFNTLNFLNQHFLKNSKVSCFKLFNKFTPRILPLNKTSTTQVANRPFRLSFKSMISIWLCTCSGMVYTAISLGGYTRLTESGLSMVTWRFSYEKKPKTEEEWIEEFDKYKQFPEFKMLKKDLTLNEFKTIYNIEYFHRFWGRVLGATFFIPAVFFWMKGGFKPAMKKRILAFGSLIVAQGLLGWYMVKSGLEDRFKKETDVPRVSQYRLAAHLTLALTLYSGLVWTALEVTLPTYSVATVTAHLNKIRNVAFSCKGLVFLTALTGAFVAGLDAGLVYNSFPKMGDKWIPDDILSYSPFFTNFTENPTTVQFIHRIMATTTFSSIMYLWILCRKQPLPTRTKILTNALALAALFQVGLGIDTLLNHVPLERALAHQNGSVLLLTVALALSFDLRKFKYIPK